MKPSLLLPALLLVFASTPWPAQAGTRKATPKHLLAHPPILHAVGKRGPSNLRQLGSGRVATHSQAASTLPPMAPTVGKEKETSPQLQPGMTLKGPAKPGHSSNPLSAAEVRTQTAPSEAAPLRPAGADPRGTLPKIDGDPRPVDGQALLPAAKGGPQIAGPALQAPSTGPRPKERQAFAPSIDTPAAVVGANSTLATPDVAKAGGPAPKESTLPPGPLTSLPLNISATPNELRISGLGSSSAPWSIVLLLTGLSLLPSILICATPFARLLVVFHFLRQALGLQTTPSNQTLIGLTLILTFFIMEPVGKQIYEQSLLPFENGQITAFQAIARGEEPMRDFMVHFVREKDAALFLEIAKEPRPRDIHDLSMRVLLPAYIVSELKAGFQIGAVLFLPFLVVDMVVASITTSVGMMQLPPVVISTPLKLLLFLMVDGWHLLIGSLVRSFT